MEAKYVAFLIFAGIIIGIFLVWVCWKGYKIYKWVENVNYKIRVYELEMGRYHYKIQRLEQQPRIDLNSSSNNFLRKIMELDTTDDKENHEKDQTMDNE